jgi:hypothetical protein
MKASSKPKTLSTFSMVKRDVSRLSFSEKLKEHNNKQIRSYPLALTMRKDWKILHPQIKVILHEEFKERENTREAINSAIDSPTKKFFHNSDGPPTPSTSCGSLTPEKYEGLASFPSKPFGCTSEEILKYGMNKGLQPTLMKECKLGSLKSNYLAKRRMKMKAMES